MLLNILKQILSVRSRSFTRPDKAGSSELMLKAARLYEQGQLDKAISIMHDVLAVAPLEPGANLRIALYYKETGDLNKALLHLENYTACMDTDADVYDEIGRLYQELDLPAEAIRYHQNATRVRPDFYTAWNNLGNAFSNTRQFEKASDAYVEAIRIKPDYAIARNNLGLALTAQGKFIEAVPEFEKAIELDSDYALAYNNLANALQGLKQYDEAISHLQTAYRLAPNNAGIINNLGIAYSQASLYSKSLDYYEKALSIEPGYADVYQNIAISLESMGQFEQAAENFKKALAINPSSSLAYTGYLFCLNYNTNLDEEFIFREHRKWGETVRQKSSESPAFDYKHKRLRIGYLSPDLRAHPVSFFIEPVLEQHDSEQFEIYVYHDHMVNDKVTNALKQHVEHWCDVVRLTDTELANRVRNDEIDILVELAGHTATNRMQVLAEKVAPVQVNYLGYPNTTGLSTIDYRLTDAWADPEGQTEKFYTETLYRLPGGFLCYKPPQQSPEIKPAPSTTNDFITFGCFNNAKKINSSVIGVWAEILHDLPGSRLLMKSQHYRDEKIRDNFIALFDEHDIDSTRIEFISWSEDFFAHMDLYNRVDIALDPFPYNGTTTTCEALWMGVPVITLSGVVHRGRVGISLLSQLNLQDALCCDSKEKYIAVARKLADNPEQLSTYRRTLRNFMLHSGLTDAKQFTRSLEDFYKSTV